MKNSIFFLILLTFLIIGCKKVETISSIQWVTVEKDIPIFKITFLNDSVGFACGGKRDNEGYIYKTIDKGNTWNKIYSSDYNRCLYDITFINDSIGYAGGDYSYLIKTKDGGSTWNIYWFKSSELAFHEKNRPDIKKIKFISDSVGYFVGGENYSAGAIYKTFNQGKSWTYDTLQKELNDITFSNENYGWAIGFGYVGKTINGNDFTETSLSNDFYTGINYLEDNSFVLVSNSGKIYKNNIDEWEKIINTSGGFNDVHFDANKGYAVGNNGLILISEDYGTSWKKLKTNKKPHFQNIVSTSICSYICCSNGEIAIIAH